MKKLIKIDLTENVKDTCLDALTMPEEAKILKEKLKPLLISETYSDIDDLINSVVVSAMNNGYEVGFQTANNLIGGNLEFTININE